MRCPRGVGSLLALLISATACVSDTGLSGASADSEPAPASSVPIEQTPTQEVAPAAVETPATTDPEVSPTPSRAPLTDLASPALIAEALISIRPGRSPGMVNCISASLRRTDPGLPERLVALGGFDNLDDGDRVTSAVVVFDCNDGLAALRLAGDLFTLPHNSGFFADCLTDALASEPDRNELILDLTLLTNDRQLEERRVDLLTELVRPCVLPFAVAQTVIGIATPLSEADANRLGGGLDFECLVNERTEVLTRHFVELRTTGAVPDLTRAVPEEIGPDFADRVIDEFLRCLSYGRAVDREASEQGIELSEQSITCIDQTLEATLRGDATADGLDDLAQVCLSPTEFAALGG